MPFYLSDNTADDVNSLIQQRKGDTTYGRGKNGSPRGMTFCYVTAGTHSPYTATTCYPYANGSWEYYTTGVSLIEVNGNKLSIGQYYLAVQTGDDGSGNPVFVCGIPGAAGFGSSASSTAGSNASSSGSTIPTITDVYCSGNSVMGTQQKYSGSVTIGGIAYSVSFTAVGS
jgi:hypothetical protein